MALLFFTVNIIAAFIAMASVTQLETSHYLWGGVTMTAGGTFLARFGTYAILMSNMIPISLLVTMDMVKFLASIFIQLDEDMYYEEMDVACQVRCLDLIEELGMIEHVFSDKTGTLTSNSTHGTASSRTVVKVTAWRFLSFIRIKKILIEFETT